jgi:hypothetical protein
VLLVGLFPLIALGSDGLMAQGAPSAHGASWYPEERPPFSDAPAAVRREIWTPAVSAPSPDDPDGVKAPRTCLDRVMPAAYYPA